MVAASVLRSRGVTEDEIGLAAAVARDEMVSEMSLLVMLSEVLADQVTNKATEFMYDALADGEWHSQHELVGDLIRTSASEYAIRSALLEIRSDPMIEAESRRGTFLHIPSWRYRLRGRV